MAALSEPAAELSQLPKADGSATFLYRGFAVTAAVNGPVEAQRRDENAFEALVDVNVRPAAGVGGTAERLLESIIQAALRQLIPVRSYPRSMFQVTLQVVETPENAYENSKVMRAQLDLCIIPALLHASILGLLTAAVPLKVIMTATTLAIKDDSEGSIVIEPTAVEARQARSVHVLGFNSNNKLLLQESEGAFSEDEWERVLEAGERVCCLSRVQGSDTVMEDVGAESISIRDFMRSVMQSKTARDLYWQ